ncbi:MAG TPA: DUF3015 domain-containing protein [Nitrospiria bacterium]
MIRKLIIAVVFVAFALIPMSSTLAAMASDDSGSGCGLGQMLWKETGHAKGILPQTLAGTTNGIFLNQWFGITSGTLGCTNDGLVKNDQQIKVFASANLDDLSQEMAQGRGEHLSALASLMGVPADRQAGFFAMTQEKYTSLFKSETTTSDEMLVALNQELATRSTLSQVATQ